MLLTRKRRQGCAFHVIEVTVTSSQNIGHAFLELTICHLQIQCRRGTAILAICFSSQREQFQSRVLDSCLKAPLRPEGTSYESSPIISLPSTEQTALRNVQHFGPSD